MKKSLVLILAFITTVCVFSTEITVLNAPQGWLYVDGQPMFDSPRTFDVSPGEHDILLIAWGMAPYHTRIEVGSEDQTLRILMKPLKGWVKKVGILVLQSGEDLENNTISKMMASVLEEYNVDASVIEIHRESPFGAHKGTLAYAEILAHPWKYGIVGLYALRALAKDHKDLDFLIVGEYKTYDDRYSSKKAGVLRYIVYDLKEEGILRTPRPYSDYEIYPSYSERYYKFDKVPPVFMSLIGRSSGEDPIEIGKKAFSTTLPYLLDMLVVYSTWKGIDIEVLKAKNPDVNWEDLRWYLEKCLLATQNM